MPWKVRSACIVRAGYEYIGFRTARQLCPHTDLYHNYVTVCETCSLIKQRLTPLSSHETFMTQLQDLIQSGKITLQK